MTTPTPRAPAAAPPRPEAAGSTAPPSSWPPTPSAEPGYTFAGWSDGSATYAAGATYTLASNGSAIVLTATWTANATDDYSYAAGTGSGTAPAGGSGLDGTTVVLAPNTFSRAGLHLRRLE